MSFGVLHGQVMNRHAGGLGGTAGAPQITDGIATASPLCKEESCCTNLRTQRAASYSIASSARASCDIGTTRPSALAALRLMTSSNLVGSSTGRSAGLAPFKILST